MYNIYVQYVCSEVHVKHVIDENDMVVREDLMNET